MEDMINQGDPSGQNISRRYDGRVKALSSRRDVIAMLLKGCVPEYRDCDVEIIRDKCLDDANIDLLHPVFDKTERILGGNTEDNSAAEGRVNFDVFAYAKHPQHPDEGIGLVVDIELQNNASPGYPLLRRALYYACRLVSSQKGTLFSKSDYGGLRKVYSLWICPNAPMKLANTVSLYSMGEQMLAGNGGRSLTPQEECDLISVIVIRLNDNVPAAEDVKLPMLRLLQAMLSNAMAETTRRESLMEEFALADEIGKEVDMVYGLGDAVIREGIPEGKRGGKTEGTQGKCHWHGQATAGEKLH